MDPRTCLSWWFPRLQAAGLPVPRTEVVRTDCELLRILDAQTPDGLHLFLADLRRAVEAIGTPCFLRTGQTAGKHDWARTCFLAEADALGRHVGALVEYSAMADLFGLPVDVWAAREMLPTRPVAMLPRYGGMPLVKQVRCFVEGGEVCCWHGYWPPVAVADGRGLPRASPLGGVRFGSPEDASRLAVLIAGLTPGLRDEPAWRPLAEKAAAAFAADGAWSVDLLATDRGWFVTDMAPAEVSFHFSPCPVGAARWPQCQRED